jgi:hypothetical protein
MYISFPNNPFNYYFLVHVITSIKSGVKRWLVFCGQFYMAPPTIPSICLEGLQNTTKNFKDMRSEPRILQIQSMNANHSTTYWICKKMDHKRDDLNKQADCSASSVSYPHVTLLNAYLKFRTNFIPLITFHFSL